MEIELRPGERADDLQCGGLRILQKTDGFRFGMDAVLLAHFARLRPHDRAVDLGTGTGVLPLLISARYPAVTFEAFEWQNDMAEMAERSVRLNGLEERIHIHSADYRTAARVLGNEAADAVVCNPPYGKRDSVLMNQIETITRARHETDCSLVETVAACGAVLRNGGRAFFCYPAQRFLELCDALRGSRLQPKRVRMVCAKAERAPYLMLVEAVKGAKPALLWLPPLIVYRADGRETDELRAVYAGQSANPDEWA